MALLCGLCEVIFDVDTGNQVQHVVPADAFSEEELADIAFSAFPDSMSMELSSRSSVRDSSFAFRLRRRAAPHAAAPPHPFLYGHVFCRQRQDERLRRGCEQRAVVLLSHLPLPGVLELMARLVGPAALSARERCADVLQQVHREVQHWPPLEWGGHMDLPLLGLALPLRLQLPMLNTLPSSALPAAVAAAQGQQQQQEQAVDAAGSDNGGDSAATAAAAVVPATGHHDSTATPAQVAAALADELDGGGLPLCLLPQAYGQQELEASPFGSDCDCYTPLRCFLPQLWALWELLLLGEPLMVVAPTPGACSAAVSALLSLMAPFPYSLDWRPYFTIHDQAFARLAAGEVPTPANGLPMLIGFTNLYLIKAIPAWPNVLATGHTAATLAPSSSSDRLNEAASAGSANGNHGSSGSLHGSESATSLSSSAASLPAIGGSGGGALGAKQSSSGSWLGGSLRRSPASPAALLSSPVDHCWLQYKPCSRPDNTVLDRLVQPQPTDPGDRWRRLAAVNSGILRRHFQELTKALLFPLLPFLTPSQPPHPTAEQTIDPKAAEAGSQPPPLRPLDPDALLEQLGGRDAILPDILLQRFGGQRRLLLFYERFLRSPTLAAFMRTRRLAAEEWQRQEWAAAAAAAAAPMRELLSVEHFFSVEQHLSSVRVQLATAAGGAEAGALAAQLEAQLRLAFEGLPSDLQQAILQTPSHAALLGLAEGPTAAAEAAAAVEQAEQPEGAEQQRL